MAQIDLEFDLHPRQLEVYKDNSRFKVVVAGRRFGKTVLARTCLGTDALQTKRHGIDLKGTETWYLAPTYDQAASIMWRPLKDVLGTVIKKTWETELTAELVNGRIIKLKGADNPDRLRGNAVSFVAIDEYASMRPDVWEYALSPALADVAPASKALFIGSPAGANHFYDLYQYAREDKTGAWKAWSFRTIDNPYIDQREIEAASKRMTEHAFAQEFLASFETDAGKILPPDNLIVIEKGIDHVLTGNVYMAVDLAGFSSSATERRSVLTQRDETSICTVCVSQAGWHILEIKHGQWNVRETATQILASARKHRPIRIGIERGALKNAISHYLDEQQRRYGVMIPVIDLTHGGQNKQERIKWALAGRLEHMQLSTEPGPWVKPLQRQMRQFPAPRARDDIIDSLAFIDQMAPYVAADIGIKDYFHPVDADIGY